MHSESYRCNAAILSSWWWLIPRRRELGEGWWSFLVCSLVAVESNSWCAHSTALWTDKGLGWRWLLLGCCSLFLRPASFLCGFMPLVLELTTAFSHWWALTISVWGLLLPWLMAVYRLCKLSLQLVYKERGKSHSLTKRPSSRPSQRQPNHNSDSYYCLTRS